MMTICSPAFACSSTILWIFKTKGQECNLEKIEADIEQRDYQDMHRENSPLRQAEDATLVDSSNMSIEEVVAAIKKLYEDVCNA